MLWILIALSAHLSWAFVNVGDQYVVVNKIKNPFIFMIWINLLGVVTFAMIPFVPFVIPNFQQFLFLLLAAALYFFGGFPYIKALQEEEVTRINIWWFLIPVFSLIMSWIFLGEYLHGQQIIAFFILIIATILASLHIGSKIVKFSKTAWLMTIACVAFASYATIIRYLTAFEGMTFLNTFVWVNILMFIFALMLFGSKKIRQSSAEELKRVNLKLGTTIFSLYFIDHLGILLNLWALSLAPAALVYAMEGFQAIFVFIIVIILSLFTFVKLKEELDYKNIILKITTLILGVVGILVLNL